MALEEHQSALELIMKKYREQVNTLIATNRWESSLASGQDQSQVLYEPPRGKTNNVVSKEV